MNNPRNPTQKRKEALEFFRRAIAIDPANHNARVGVANMLCEQNKPGEALIVCEEGLKLGFHDQLALTHAKVVLTLGRADEGLSLLQRVISVSPDDPAPRASFAASQINRPWATPAEVAQAHLDFGRVREAATPALNTPRPSPSDADRPLRVAFMSPDLRRHSVAFFAEPIFELLDRKQFSILAYHSSIFEDDFSKRLRAHASIWRQTPFDTDDVVAEMIAKDRVDILIDLAGLTSGGRLGTLAARPAPLQVTYCGYPDTTGISRVDYRIVDSHTDPREWPTRPTFDERASERLWRLDPCFLCYRPPAGSPEPRIGERRDGQVVFGSFNAARKLNDRVAQLWARVLAAVPDSRLALKSVDFKDPNIAGPVLATFERAGIRDRVDLLQPTDSIEQHLAMYEQIDVALDTIPYNGTTTTCEALWMGVPVVAVAGDMHVSRVGVSLLHAANLPELVAPDESSFVRIATDLAQDSARRALLRATLRERVRTAPLCDRAAFALRFGNALRAMWRAACA
jgi:predicted O-linked N-acetylglucosamine transferase (SPINDLY family)